METITACENVCRDFSWFPPVIGVVANLATIAAVLLAFQQWFSWRSQRISLQQSEIAVELVALLSELSQLLRAIQSDDRTYLLPYGRDAQASALAAEMRRLTNGIAGKGELIGILNAWPEDASSLQYQIVSDCQKYTRYLEELSQREFRLEISVTDPFQEFQKQMLGTTAGHFVADQNRKIQALKGSLVHMVQLRPSQR